jgi:hypothetical protein
MPGATFTGGGSESQFPGLGQERIVHFDTFDARVSIARGVLYHIAAEIERDAIWHVGVDETRRAHIVAVEYHFGRRDADNVPAWLEAVLLKLGAREVLLQ